MSDSEIGRPPKKRLIRGTNECGGESACRERAFGVGEFEIEGEFFAFAVGGGEVLFAVGRIGRVDHFAIAERDEAQVTFGAFAFGVWVVIAVIDDDFDD